jgi:hypothetical protein
MTESRDIRTSSHFCRRKISITVEYQADPCLEERIGFQRRKRHGLAELLQHKRKYMRMGVAKNARD